MDDFRYTYAVARINALSTGLLDREFASRLLAAETDDIPGMLGETPYAENLAGVESPIGIEKALFREMEKTYGLLDKICPEKEVIKLFRMRFDFHNLKAMLKSQMTGAAHADSIMDIGTFSIGELSAAVREKNYRFIPDYLRSTALDALAEYERSQKLESISYVCDRSMWRHLMKKALKCRNKIIKNLFREYVNLANIKSFFRIKEMGEVPSDFERYFIPGGSYSLDFFFLYMNQELGLFLDHLAKTPYERHIVSQGFMMWPEDRSFWRLEVACDDFILHYYWKRRMRLFSIVPLIYYLLRKMAEVRLIRTVVRCKLIGMPRKQIEERLGYLYV